MNKVRILGVILIVTAVILNFTLAHDLIDFASGLLLGSGIALVITGKISRKPLFKKVQRLDNN
ncbi:MAG TPA: hypothetical protein ENH91_09765 [Leeuwenhoekiella sp.]|nr:hypothetical protein [Leeuwenhoekiella sp.]